MSFLPNRAGGLATPGSSHNIPSSKICHSGFQNKVPTKVKTGQNLLECPRILNAKTCLSPAMAASARAPTTLFLGNCQLSPSWETGHCREPCSKAS